MRSWYLLYTKPREESRAKTHLENQDYEVFLPQVTVEKLRRNKRVEVEEALFPGYLFINIDLQNDNAGPIRSTRGVNGFVRFGLNLPPPIPAEIVETLQQRVECLDESLLDPMQELPQKGDKVVITSGRFENIEAIFQVADGETRSILLLDMLGKRVKASFDNKEFEKKS